VAELKKTRKCRIEYRMRMCGSDASVNVRAKNLPMSGPMAHKHAEVAKTDAE
jgi:hypothetical protein